MRKQALIALSLSLLATATFAPAAPLSQAKIKQNLDRIPASDPAPAAVPELLASVRGQHPRVLFTKAEIDKLKKEIAADPFLKKTYEDVSAWSKKFTLAKAWQPKAILTEDTPAIMMLKSWPGLAYTYAIERDANTKQAILDILQMMLEAPHWADTDELDSNMGAAENMAMVGMLYDVIHDDLEPGFRAKMADKILTHCRRMYYLGHQKLCLMPIKYWQNDPANNHRWHRDLGMVSCLLAIADDKKAESGFLLEKMKGEMDFLVNWYPHDGDCHEGAGYQVFGFFYLALAAQIMDRNLGTRYLEHPGFRNAWAQQVYYTSPGRNSNISFGDDMNGKTVFDNQETAFFIGPMLSRNKDVQAMLKLRFEQQFKNIAPGRKYSYPWGFLAFYDGTVGEGDYKKLPTSRLFDDLGAASLRDTWEDNGVCFTFKCGPYGGYKLNEYSHANKDENGKPCYINVAHDDPDANSFAIGINGEFLFHPGLYSLNKVTRSHSTITVDGKGQINEGSSYTQPVPNTDMRKLSYITAWKTGDHGRVIVEGEAGAAYPDKMLSKYRRSMIYMPGDYVLILDDIAANGTRQVTWRGIVEKGQFDDPANGRCHAYTKNGKERIDFQIIADRDFTGAIDYAFLDGRFGNQLMQQFLFEIKTDAVRFACVMDPWKTKPALIIKTDGAAATLTVQSEKFTDTWTWRQAADSVTPSDISCKREGKELISLTPADKVASK